MFYNIITFCNCLNVNLYFVKKIDIIKMQISYMAINTVNITTNTSNIDNNQLHDSICFIPILNVDPNLIGLTKYI